jgi:hypothetical protein
VRKKIEHSICFPSFFGSNNQMFRFAFCELRQTPSNIRVAYKEDKNGFENFQNRIKIEFETGTEFSENVLISSEFLFLSQKEEIQTMKDYLAFLGFTDIAIFMYIRNPTSYYLSSAQQSLRTGAKLIQPMTFFYDFKKQISVWKEQFPNTTVRLFSNQALINGDVVQDFNEYLNHQGFDVEIPSIKLNEGMSTEALQVMQYFHRQQPMNTSKSMYASRKKILKSFIQRFSQMGTKPHLKSPIRSVIENRFWEDALWLKKTFELDLGFAQHRSDEQISNLVDFKELVEGFDDELYLYLRNQIDILVKEQAQ